MENLIKLTTIDVIVITAYIAVLFGIAVWASFGRKRQGTLFLANRSLGWFAIGLTMWGTNVGPSMLIANASGGFEKGLAAGNYSWYAIPFVCLLAFVFAPRYLGAGVTTLPEYMGRRFGESTRKYIAWYTIITVVISWLGAELFVGGVFFSQMVDFPLWVCIVILVVVSAAFTMMGGLRAIAYTNVFQMTLLIAVTMLLAVVAVVKVGGFGVIAEKTPGDYWSMFQPLTDVDFPWLAILLGYPVMGIWFYCTDQSMVQSVLGARSMKHGQTGANFYSWLKLLDIPLFILPGILCIILLPELTKSSDAYLQLVAHLFPPGLVGLVIVVMTAALISTIASALNSLSAVFTMDILMKKQVSENTTVRTGRIVVLAGSLLSIVFAMGISFIQGLSFFNMLMSVLGFVAPPMAVVFLFAVFHKKTSSRAINIVLTAGTVFSIGTGILYYCGLILQGVHFLYISFAIFVFLSAFLFLFSMYDRAHITGDIPFTRQPADPKIRLMWAILILVMIVLYIIFR